MQINISSYSYKKVFTYFTCLIKVVTKKYSSKQILKKNYLLKCVRPCYGNPCLHLCFPVQMKYL